MAQKRTRLHLVAESCIIWSSRSRRPVRKLLDTSSYAHLDYVKNLDIMRIMRELNAQAMVEFIQNYRSSWKTIFFLCPPSPRIPFPVLCLSSPCNLIEQHSMKGIFLFTTASRTALGPTQPPIQWVPESLSLGVKRPGGEACHSPPSNSEVNVRGAISPFPKFAFMVWCLVKHRDNFAFF
jgi:hypothetical protein